MPKPKLGDKRPTAPCPYCGAPRFEVYTQFPVYHNTYDKDWQPESLHGTPDYRGDLHLGFCVKYLREQLDLLKYEVRHKGGR